MIKILSLSYKHLVTHAYKALFFSEDAPFTFSKQYNKYRLTYRFPKKKFYKLASTDIVNYLTELSNKYIDHKILVLDTCYIGDNYLSDIYGNQISDSKKKILDSEPNVKYYFTDRSIRLPENQIADIFDAIFNKWFENSSIKNIYFVRCKTLPFKEALSQAKYLFKGIEFNEINESDDTILGDLNDVIYSSILKKLNNPYPKNQEFQNFIEKLIFPYD